MQLPTSQKDVSADTHMNWIAPSYFTNDVYYSVTPGPHYYDSTMLLASTCAHTERFGGHRGAIVTHDHMHAQYATPVRAIQINAGAGEKGNELGTASPK